ncbi:hypothetical protein GQR58_016107 [Nymphon striatum]|nr:hypothetical protein GQR58_016107 [Nymphon striatum]
MLSLFSEKADNPAMVKHGLDLLKTLTDFLNPGQTPVLACDCPIFAIGKRILWKFPELYDEDKFIILFGGLHLEKALWNVLRDLLQCSGWSEALVEAEIATSGIADSFLKLVAICASLGNETTCSLPAFHAYSGCDTTSSFFGKGKMRVWNAWKNYPSASRAFIYIFDNPFAPVDLSSQHFKDIERLTVILYDKTSTLEFVNECRKQLFAQRGNLESIPPTQDALLLHVQRTAYQTGILATCRTETPDVPTPDKWGWKILDGYNYQPIWMTISEAAKVYTDLIKCRCKSAGRCTRCKCIRSNLPCTDLC